MNCKHQELRLRIDKPPRCTACGHRVAYGHYVPRQTRTMPPWKWPVELIERRRARRLFVPD